MELASGVMKEETFLSLRLEGELILKSRKEIDAIFTFSIIPIADEIESNPDLMSWLLIEEQAFFGKRTNTG